MYDEIWNAIDNGGNYELGAHIMMDDRIPVNNSEDAKEALREIAAVMFVGVMAKMGIKPENERAVTWKELITTFDETDQEEMFSQAGVYVELLQDWDPAIADVTVYADEGAVSSDNIYQIANEMGIQL